MSHWKPLTYKAVAYIKFVKNPDDVRVLDQNNVKALWQPCIRLESIRLAVESFGNVRRIEAHERIAVVGPHPCFDIQLIRGANGPLQVFAADEVLDGLCRHPSNERVGNHHIPAAILSFTRPSVDFEAFAAQHIFGKLLKLVRCLDFGEIYDAGELVFGHWSPVITLKCKKALRECSSVLLHTTHYSV